MSVDGNAFEHAGREDGLHRLEQIFYDSVLADPLLQPVFGSGRPEHVDHLASFTAESFGGPDRFSREVGFAHLIAVHRGLRITEDQRPRFVELYWRRSARRRCRPTRRFATRCGSTSSSAQGSRCRTLTPTATTSCTRCATFPAGRGRATTIER